MAVAPGKSNSDLMINACDGACRMLWRDEYSRLLYSHSWRVIARITKHVLTLRYGTVRYRTVLYVLHASTSLMVIQTCPATRHLLDSPS